MKRLGMCLVLGFLLGSTPLLADSDGNFCARPGYLAYEFSSSKEMPHTLFVIYFDSQVGILNPKTVTIDDFQVHGMKCALGTVEIQAFDKSYFFDVSDRNKQPTVIPKAPPRFDATDSVSGNLGPGSKPAVFDLGPEEAGNSFQLVIARAERRTTGGLEHFTVSALIQRTRQQKTLHFLLIFNGISLETIDGNSQDRVPPAPCSVSMIRSLTFLLS